MSKLDFHHVTDAPIREVLERPFSRLTRGQLADAITWTAHHVAHDSDNPEIPAKVIEARAEAYVKAEDALRAGKLIPARKHLRACWSV
jgi:hypothetical protein